MEQKRLNLYTVNMKYIRDLHNQGDDRVFSVSPQVGKDSRPFLVKKAEKLYKMVGRKNGSGPLKRRCLKWSKLEQILERF